LQNPRKRQRMALDGTMDTSFRLVSAGRRRNVHSMKTIILKTIVIITIFLTLAALPAFAQNDTNRFRALVLAERGDQHEAFVVAAMEWLKATAEKDHFAMDVFENPDQFNKAFLAKYE